jgi:hypothetical protein
MNLLPLRMRTGFELLVQYGGDHRLKAFNFGYRLAHHDAIFI